MPFMQPPHVDLGAMTCFAPKIPTQWTRWRGAFVVALLLCIASTSAALIVRVGELESSADQAMLQALRQSPGLST